MNNEAAPGNVKSFLVTSGGDVSDATDGILTLREAIAEAKAAGISATISFAAAIDTVTLAQGELLIDGTSAARGVGLTIDGGSGTGVQILQEAPTGRVMHVAGSADGMQLVSLSGLTLAQGHAVDAGGGLLAEHARLDIERSSFFGNEVAGTAGTALIGGGVALLDSTTTITDSRILSNGVDATAAPFTTAAKGGGLAAVGGTLSLVATVVGGNNASSTLGGTGGGGGVYAKLDELVIAHADIDRNVLDASGGADPDRYRAWRGGGLDLEGPGETTVSYSTITGNHNGAFASYGGGVAVKDGLLTVDHSYIGGNSTNDRGGGIATLDAHLSLQNSTVYHDAGSAGGGGLDLSGGRVEIVGATIAGNVVAVGNPGGGIWSQGVTPVLVNTIVAGNTQDLSATPNDVAGAIESNASNLFSQASVQGSAPGDRLGADARLAPPADNGGPTPTMALLAGSPAFGEGNVDDARGTTDQRGAGFPRVSFGEVDIGAYQLEPDDALRLFSPGNDTVDLRHVDLMLFPGALGSQALAGNDTVRLSATQNLGTPFFASLGDDVIVGSPHLDRIAGSSGDDRLVGARGNDRLRGGGGGDTLEGGAGADRFVFRTVGDSPTGADPDVILDFTSRHDDLIVLGKIDANPALAGDQAFVWQGDDPLSGVGQLHYRHEGGDTIVEANVSGSAAPELQILLHGRLTVFAADFLL